MRVVFASKTCSVVEVYGKAGIYYWLQHADVWTADCEQGETPMHFLSDGYSVPACLWGMIRGIRSRQPAYAHDYLYLMGDMSRADADAFLRDGITATGGSRWTAWKVWAGVRIGGWLPWRRYKQLRQAHGAQAVLDAHTAQTEMEAIIKCERGLAEGLDT